MLSSSIYFFFLEPLIPRFTRCTYGKISFPTSSQWKCSLMDSLIISSRTLPREVCVLRVNMSVVTSAKWRSIIFSPQPQKLLPWQRHFAIPQYPEIAEYSLYLLLKMPCQHMVLEPRCFITSCLLLSLEKVLWLVSSVQLTFSSELLCIVLSFEKGNRRKNSDLALVLWFYESEIYSPASLLEDWLKKTSLWTLFQTRGGCNNCNLLLYISWCEGGRISIYLSVTGKNEGCRWPAFKQLQPQILFVSSNYIRLLHVAYWALELPPLLGVLPPWERASGRTDPSSAVGSWSMNSTFQMKWIWILGAFEPFMFAADVIEQVSKQF